MLKYGKGGFLTFFYWIFVCVTTKDTLSFKLLLFFLKTIFIFAQHCVHDDVYLIWINVEIRNSFLASVIHYEAFYGINVCHNASS